MPASARMAVETNGMHAAGKIVHPGVGRSQQGRDHAGGSSSTQREINQQLQQRHTRATRNRERHVGSPSKQVGDDDDDASARLTWVDLWVSVTNGRGEIRTLLHGAYGLRRTWLHACHHGSFGLRKNLAARLSCRYGRPDAHC